MLTQWEVTRGYSTRHKFLNSLILIPCVPMLALLANPDTDYPNADSD